MEKFTTINTEKNKSKKTNKTKKNTLMSSWPPAFTPASQSSSLLLPFPTTSFFFYHQLFLFSSPNSTMQNMSYIVQKLHLGFLCNPLFSIFFLFCLISVVFWFFTCPRCSCLLKESKSLDDR